jgi:CysZ protein
MKPPSAIKRFFGGTAYLGRGLRQWGSSPRAMLLGAIPPLIVSIVYVGLGIAFAVNLDVIVAWITPFADNWDPAFQQILRVSFGIALSGAVLLIGVFTFTAVTLTVGDPFYEGISRHVEAQLGDAPAELDESFWTGLLRGIGSGLRFLALTASVGLLLFVLGFIPIIGQFVVPVIGWFIGGWFLAIELSGFAFEARGLRLKDRRRMLAANRAKTLGFGVPIYLLFLIPFVAVVVMPAAVAGATMLARDAVPAPVDRLTP